MVPKAQENVELVISEMGRGTNHSQSDAVDVTGVEAAKEFFAPVLRGAGCFVLLPRGEEGILCCVGRRIEQELPAYESLFFTLSSSTKMVKPRERMPCRRGSGRGCSSRHPVADAHHHCCCCYCHRRVGASHMQASQFMDVGSPNSEPPSLPAFGTAVFTLGSISAHLSVLFVKETKENEDGEGSRASPFTEHQATDEERTGGAPEQAPAQSQKLEALSSKNVAEEEGEGTQEEYGWVPIVEEKPEE